MTAKEALERFKQPIMLADMDWNKRVQTIETALNRLEEIENTSLRVLREDISNRLKALEIIVKKRCCCWYASIKRSRC